MVPFAAGGETEQSRRAAALAGLGLVAVAEESTVSPESLARAIDRAMASPAPGPARLKLDGAESTAALLLAALSAKRS
jgi:predicted glycosyltransferase